MAGVVGVVVGVPVAAVCWFVCVFPLVDRFAAGAYGDGDGDGDYAPRPVAARLLDGVAGAIHVPHTMGRVAVEGRLCVANGGFVPAASAPLDGVPPADHAEVVREVARAWPGLLSRSGAGNVWRVSVTWDDPLTGRQGEVVVRADCPGDPAPVP